MRIFKILILTLTLGSTIEVSAQSDIKLGLEIGVLSYSLEREGWGSAYDPNLFNNAATPIFLSGRITSDRLNSSLQLSGYNYKVVFPILDPSSGNLTYNKQSWGLTYWYNFRMAGSIGVGYSRNHYKHWQFPSARTPIEEGFHIGFSSNPHTDFFPFEIRNEVAWSFYTEQPFSYWQIRTWMPIFGTDSISKKTPTFLPQRSRFIFSVHSWLSYNPTSAVQDFSNPLGMVKGYEVSFFFRKWKLSPFFLKGRRYETRIQDDLVQYVDQSEYNYAGIRYVQILNRRNRYIKYGIAHSWIAERAIDSQNPAGFTGDLYQNRGIMVDVSYPLFKRLEVFGMLDYYYMTNVIDPGIQFSRFKVGLKYSFF